MTACRPSGPQQKSYCTAVGKTSKRTSLLAAVTRLFGVLLCCAVLRCVQALSDHGFPVPTAIDNNRHAVLMELVDAQPLVQVGVAGSTLLFCCST